MRPPRIMVLGDSLASGMQDDYTWRWRLARHIWRTGAPARFVGPHTGTFSMYDDPVLLALVEGRPIPTGRQAANPMTGPYREGWSRGGHCAQPGWTAHAAKSVVRDRVAAHRPDFLLVQLGFNDLAMVGSPRRALRDLSAVVSEARAAEPAVTILVANVTGADSWGNEWFHRSVEDYNARLPAELAGLSTDRSRVALVDVRGGFDPETDTYDGIHPNPVGELAIAAAFADALREFGVGSGPFLPPPLRPRELPLAEPEITVTENVTAQSITAQSITAQSMTAQTITGHDQQAGVRLAWGRVRGASAYRVGLRDLTSGRPRRTGPIPVLGDHWLARGLTAGHLYEFDVAAARGERLGPRSKPVRVTAGA